MRKWNPQRLRDRKLPAAVRFWKLVNKMGPLHPTLGRCWDWVGYCNSDGYGLIGVNGKTVKAYRYGWELTNGEIPEGISVLHQCDRPACVNPAHLYLGTQLDSIRDMSIRDRIPLGEKKWSAKLTDDQVREIRRLYRPYCRKHGTRALAELFGVSPTTVQDVVNGVRWRHVA